MWNVWCLITVVMVGVPSLRTTVVPSIPIRDPSARVLSREAYDDYLNETQNTIGDNVRFSDPVMSRKLCLPCACGTLGREPKIIGGKPTYVNKYPWMVAFIAGNMFRCGGSLINNKYVITAAHCVYNEGKLINVEDIFIRLLEHNFTTNKESKHMDFNVLKIIVHKGYNFKTVDNDIALLRLETKGLKFIGKTKIRPVCLPANDGESYAGYNGIVIGWGMMDENGSISKQQLRELDVPILSNTSCFEKPGYTKDTITDNMICAGYEHGQKNSCQGDSGGPLHVKIKSVYYMVGIVSWGYGCARENSPGVYTRVTKYLSWIAKNTKDACTCSRPTHLREIGHIIRS